MDNGLGKEECLSKCGIHIFSSSKHFNAANKSTAILLVVLVRIILSKNQKSVIVKINKSLCMKKEITLPAPLVLFTQRILFVIEISLSFYVMSLLEVRCVVAFHNCWNRTNELLKTLGILCGSFEIKITFYAFAGFSYYSGPKSCKESILKNQNLSKECSKEYSLLLIFHNKYQSTKNLTQIWT